LFPILPYLLFHFIPFVPPVLISFLVTPFLLSFHPRIYYFFPLRTLSIFVKVNLSLCLTN
jgi:hypothetical protein